MPITIPANRLDRTFEAHRAEYETKALQVLRSGRYVLGQEVAAFETEFAAFLGAPFCVSLASGSDALWVALHLLGVSCGDEVILQGNAFFAAAAAVIRCGAQPVFVEPDPVHFCMIPETLEAAVTPRTKAVLVTHLYGMMTPMEDIVAFCRARGLRLVEDCAQAHGARWRGQSAGTFGDVGCFSFYPTKNLGAFGDGGAIVTGDCVLAERAAAFRNYGKTDGSGDFSLLGVNSRLDELQAGLLRVRLRHLADETAEKCRIAERYLRSVSNPAVALPKAFLETENVWHQFVIRCERRDALRAYLLQSGVETAVHYPVPPHLTAALRFLGLRRGALPNTERLADTVLSLPSFFGLRADEQAHIIRTVNQFQ